MRLGHTATATALVYLCLPATREHPRQRSLPLCVQSIAIHAYRGQAAMGGLACTGRPWDGHQGGQRSCQRVDVCNKGPAVPSEGRRLPGSWSAALSNGCQIPGGWASRTVRGTPTTRDLGQLPGKLGPAATPSPAVHSGRRADQVTVGCCMAQRTKPHHRWHAERPAGIGVRHRMHAPPQRTHGRRAHTMRRRHARMRMHDMVAQRNPAATAMAAAACDHLDRCLGGRFSAERAQVDERADEADRDARLASRRRPSAPTDRQPGGAAGRSAAPAVVHLPHARHKAVRQAIDAREEHEVAARRAGVVQPGPPHSQLAVPHRGRHKAEKPSEDARRDRGADRAERAWLRRL
mmetsp:Transcript_17643/g.52977  ORF Transcript_17643/g.52977 Transcript_17643/m.52977 type:complete len:349 (+) Transcript_17643:329-1375(+)